MKLVWQSDKKTESGSPGSNVNSVMCLVGGLNQGTFFYLHPPFKNMGVIILTLTPLYLIVRIPEGMYVNCFEQSTVLHYTCYSSLIIYSKMPTSL